MPRGDRRSPGMWLAVLGLAVLIAGTATAQAAPAVQPALADTATKGFNVWSVDKLGYVAEEYFVSGVADVYAPVSMADAVDMTRRDITADMMRRDFTRTTLRADRPYRTRIVVYRPADRARFSGNVIVEPFHPNGGGSGAVWGYLNGFLIRNGDAYVGVQHPITFAGLKAADPARYGALDAEDPTLLWGMLRDVGRLVKTGAEGSPLRGYDVKALFMTGYSYTGVATAVFANYHHDTSRLADGKPIFDGYLPLASSTFVRPLDVPVIRVNTEGDYNSFEGVRNRNPDSNAPVGRMRHHEVAGASHVGGFPPILPAATPPQPRAIARAPGLPNPQANPCQASFPAGAQPNNAPLPALLAAQFANMYAWARKGTPPPPGRWIEVNTDGSARTDPDGNTLGGLRSPVIDVPTATLGTGKTAACNLFGYRVDFDKAKLKSLYASPVGYLDKVRESAQARVNAHELLAPDAIDLIQRARGVQNF